MAEREIKIGFPEAKMEALEFFLKENDTTVEKVLREHLDKTYEKSVPQQVRKFVIHCENRSPVIDSTARQHSIDHGFGLSNISHTVEKNNGFFVYQQKNDIFYTDIMIPIIDESKRVFKSVNHISVHPSSHISRHTDIPVPPGRGRQ